MHFYLLSLGCPKNLVDAQGMSQLLDRAGHRPVGEPDQAEILIINTCGFIDQATEESLAALRELADHKRDDQLLIAAGCLSQRYGQSLAGQVPGLDGILGTQHWMDIAELVAALRSRDRRKPHYHLPEAGPPPDDTGVVRGAVLGGSAYLKIADGCSASCAFCVIPSIKGPARSRPAEAIAEEARVLADNEAREIVLIAQNTTAYGRDRGEGDALPGLIESILAAVPDLPWLRIMYAYPQHVTPRLVEVMARHPQVCHYLDLPLQHGHPAVLRRMSRPHDVDRVRRLLADLRRAMPDIALRTSLIVGYPGETEEEFAALLDFVGEMAFDRLGVFTYSPQEGTRAARLPGQLSEAAKRARYEQVMALQQSISLARNQRMVGKGLDVLVEGCGAGISLGRSYRDAPEVDGLVVVEGELAVGGIAPVRITGAMEYDLIGVMA